MATYLVEKTKLTGAAGIVFHWLLSISEPLTVFVIQLIITKEINKI